MVKMGSFGRGFQLAPQDQLLAKSENLFNAAVVAEQCGDRTTAEDLLARAIACLAMKPQGQPAYAA